jgi:hypothetical protein
MLPIYEYAYKLCDRCFGRIDMNMATSQIDSAVYYLIAYMHVWPRQRDMQQLQLVAYLSDEVFVES